jgi:hypothetical protein
MESIYDAVEEVRSVQFQLGSLQSRVTGDLARAVADLEARAVAVAGLGGGRGGGAGAGAPSLNAISGQLASLLDIVQDADVDPTSQVVESIQDRLAALRSAMDRWTQLKNVQLAALNRQLQAAGLPTIDPARRN